MQKKLTILLFAILLFSTFTAFAYEPVSDGGWSTVAEGYTYSIWFKNGVSKIDIDFGDISNFVVLRNAAVIFNQNDNHYEVYYDKDSSGNSGYFILYKNEQGQLIVQSFIRRQVGKMTFPQGQYGLTVDNECCSKLPYISID